MHKIHEKEFTLEDFSCEHLMNDGDNEILYGDWVPLHVLEHIIMVLNRQRERYLETKDKKYWWQMIQLLPSSYNQRRTVMLNYEVLANIYKSRKSHKLDEWIEFCDWIESLPYSELITGPDLSRTPICNEIMEEAKRRAREENIVPVDRDSVLYICDQKQCKNCSYPTCKHTEDVNHAANFTKEEIGHWEKEK